MSRSIEVLGPVDADDLEDDEPIVATELVEEDEPPREPPVVIVRSNAVRCPFCREDVDTKKKNWVACASCLARHHKGCWRESRKCASCGLKKHLVAPNGMSVPASRGRVSVAKTKRLLGHEGHVKAIAFWNTLAGGLLAIVCLFLMVAAQGSRSADAGFMSTGLFLLASGLLASGIALWNYVSWARWLTLFLNVAGVVAGLFAANYDRDVASAAMSIFANLVWSAATIWALTTGKANGIFHPQYQGLIERDRTIKVAWYASPFFWAPWIAMGIQIVYALSTAAPAPTHYYYR